MYNYLIVGGVYGRGGLLERATKFSQDRYSSNKIKITIEEKARQQDDRIQKLDEKLTSLLEEKVLEK
jgi:2C-methyl-D-erythritol 2,4-cyclodiphosphate synthase